MKNGKSSALTSGKSPKATASVQIGPPDEPEPYWTNFDSLVRRNELDSLEWNRSA